MICKKIKHLVNEAILKGSKSLIINDLTEREQEDLLECGYTFKKEGDKFIINI